MFTKSLRIGSLFGFDIKIDLSWLLIATLITWSLASGYFPQAVPDLSNNAYWTMGVLGALGLFGSVILHELGHALVARRFGLEMGGITLFIFGGVAEMTDDPPSPKAEFWVAVGGPIVSAVLAGLLWGLGVIPLPQTVGAVIGYLAFINTALLVFNLIPAFPLDGGRVLRAWIWQRKNSLRKGTRIASEIGSGFGLVLIIMGVLQFLGGATIGGIWYAILGLFLRGIAKASYQQVLVKRILQGTPVKRLMTTDLVSTDPDQRLDTFVEETLYRYHHKLVPVVRDGQPVGIITPAEVSKVAREDWQHHTVGAVMTALADEHCLDAGTDATDALSRFNRSQRSRALVTEGKGDDRQLIGILTLKDLMSFLSLKLELEEDDDDATALPLTQAKG
ncbi:MAG: site-2 protease family protein [Opitutales bacterium]